MDLACIPPAALYRRLSSLRLPHRALRTRVAVYTREGSTYDVPDTHAPFLDGTLCA